MKKKISSRVRIDELWTNKKSYGFQQRQRNAITYSCEHVYSELHPDQWKSFNLIPKIIKHLKLSRSAHPMVERVLLDFYYCVKNGIEYKGGRECNQWGDEKLLLSSKSLESKIIADITEDGHGLRAVWQFVNEYR